MTRKTKFHSLTYNNIKIIYRDLNVREIGLLLGIKNLAIRCEMAAKLAIIEPTNLNDIPIGIIAQVGNNAILNSTKVFSDKELFEIAVKEYRTDIGGDNLNALTLIGEILKVLPGQSFTDLLNLTYEDLIELACLCESIKGSKIFSFGEPPGKKKGTKLVNTSELPDKGKSLREKMAELNSFLNGTQLQ